MAQEPVVVEQPHKPETRVAYVASRVDVQRETRVPRRADEHVLPVLDPRAVALVEHQAARAPGFVQGSDGFVDSTTHQEVHVNGVRGTDVDRPHVPRRPYHFVHCRGQAPAALVRHWEQAFVPFRGSALDKAPNSVYVARL